MNLLPVGAFIVFICVCLDLPEALDSLMGWHFPLLTPFIPHLSVFWVPFVFASVIMNVAKPSQDKGEMHEVFDRSDLGILFLIIVWYAIECFHVLSSGSDFFPEIIVSYLWVFFFYFGIKSFTKIIPVHKLIVRTVICVSFFMSLLQLMAYFGILSSVVPDFNLFSQRPRIDNVNRSSYIALLGICLWMFFLEKEERGVVKLYFGLMILTNVFLIIVNQTRAAVPLICTLLLLKGVALKKDYLNIAILGSLVVVGLLTLSLFPSTINELEKSLSFGRGFTHETEASYKGITEESENQETSVSVRLKTSGIVLQKITESPLLGIGHSEMKQIRIGDHRIHTHYLLILGTYGIVGAMALFFLLFQFGIQWSDIPWEKKAALGVLFFGATTFLRDVCWWYAILGILMINSKTGKIEHHQH